MAKKSDFQKPTRFNIWKGRTTSKWRAMWRLIRADHFIYMDRKALVGAFDNHDLVHYMEKFGEVVDMTEKTLTQVKNKLEGKEESASKTANDKFAEKLAKVTKSK